MDEIVAAAREQVREHGLAGLSLRDLGARVGMRAQSLYSYFASKHEIYDAMFAQGNQEFLEWMTDDSDGGEHRDATRRRPPQRSPLLRVLRERSGPIPVAVPADDPGLRPVGRAATRSRRLPTT